MRLLPLGFIFLTDSCNRPPAKPELEDTSIEMYEQLNEMEEDILGEGKQFDFSIDSPSREKGTEEKLLYEDFSDLK
jgi:hypothetical protein